MTSSPPTVLSGRWRLEGQLGFGGMGTVHQATELDTQRTVAVKMMAPSLAEDAEQVARFEREAKLLSKFDHPSLVPLLAVDRHEGVPFIVLKYVKGKTLGALLKERKRFAVRQLLPLLQQLASALDYLHARGVVHRDLKPKNVMVDDDEHLTLLDFGVSRHLKSPRLTEPGMLVGTPLYMAPEQILTDHAGPPADLYALALMTYQLLVGEHPFADSSGGQVITRQLGELPVGASLKNPAVPEPVARVIERSLQKDPALRHPSATAFYDDLVVAFGADSTDSSQKNLKTVENEKTVEDSRPPPAPPTPRSSWPVVLVVVAALTLAAVVWIFR